MKVSLTDHFAERMKVLREEKGLTQEKLAEAAKVSLNYVTALECSRRSPSFAMVEKIAKAMKIDPRQFFAI